MEGKACQNQKPKYMTCNIVHSASMQTSLHDILLSYGIFYIEIFIMHVRLKHVSVQNGQETLDSFATSLHECVLHEANV